jgi:glycosyltransferase involved in cell wall biosynthesis
LARRARCQEYAKQFDQQIFAVKIKKIIERTDPRLPLLAIDASRDSDPRTTKMDKRTGVEIYSHNTIKALVLGVEKYKVRLRLYAPRPLAGFSTEIQKIIPGKKLWTLCKLASELKQKAPDCFFTPGYFLPAGAPANSFATIHDVKFKSVPRSYALTDRLWQEYAFWQNNRHAKCLFTVSEGSRQEIIKFYQVDPSRVVSLPICYDRWLMGELSQIVREKIIFFVGRIDKKKSVDILINGFSEFVKDNPGWQLVLAGQDGFGADKIHELVFDLGLAEVVKFVGYVDDSEKGAWFSRASLFIHPGAAEGSALPLFEAWDANVPSIVAATPLMRELADEAVIYFKPGDQADLASCMSKVLANQALQERLKKQGIDRLAPMSGKKVADKMLSRMLLGVAEKSVE